MTSTPNPNPEPISTINDFMISSNGERLAPLLPVMISTREQAYRTAAWLKTLGEILPSEAGDDSDGPSFEDVEQAIRNT